MKPGSNHIALAAMLSAAFFLYAACATKPPAPPPAAAPTGQPAQPSQPVQTTQPAQPSQPAQPAAPPAPTVSQEDLDKLLAEAKDLKKKAFDLKLFEVLPDDYKAAEAAFASASASYDAKDAKAAKDNLGTTIALYNDLIARGVVARAAAEQKNADDMKATALKAEADQKAPERFGPAEEAYNAAVALVSDGKHEEAIAAFHGAMVDYELAYKRAEAGDLRVRIADQDYAKSDPGNFQLAENKYAAEPDLWSSGTDADKQAGIDALDEAILRYNLIIEKGRQSVAVSAKDVTDAAKARAEEIKAPVAVKDHYDQAVADYEDAVSMLGQREYEDADAKFQKATEEFGQAYDAAAEKKAKAEAAMKTADEATAASERKAEEADALVNAPQAQ